MCSGSYKGPLIKPEKIMTVIVKVNNPGYLGFVRLLLGLYWGYIGIMEKNMETTTIQGFCRVQGLRLITWSLGSRA